MKTTRFALHCAALLLALCQTAATLSAQDTIWVRYDDRFKPNYIISLKDVDSIEVRPTQMRLYSDKLPSAKYTPLATNTRVPTDEASMMFSDPGRYLLKPNTYSGTDYTNAAATSGYNFAHSVESAHFAVFWDIRYGDTPTKIQYPGDGNVANANTVLSICERCWNMYANELGFLEEGNSTTDKYKIQLYIPYQSAWRADASGTDGVGGGQTGIGHFNPWAATARGGHTVAHEVGHTFQFLVSADLGTNAWHTDRGWRWGWGGGNDNGWWESCADWQAYQIFPDRQFTDGEYFEQHLAAHYKNLLHDDWRYACCFIQDWWCMKYGRDFIGRMWRESRPYEDPVDVYKRMNNLTQEQFCDETMEGYMRMATWDIDRVRDRAAHRIGQHKNYLTTVSSANAIYKTSPATCIQNYGYHITNLTPPKAGATVKANFTGITDDASYHYVYKDRAGWRYAFVALMSDGTRVYGDMHSLQEGTAELTIPTDHGRCSNLFFVVMGAPTQHWAHPWTSGKASSDWDVNEEQWPYQVQFEGTKVK